MPGVSVRVFEEDRCGPGSLALVLSAVGEPVTDRELAPLLPESPRGVLSVDLLLAARQRGFDAALVAGTREEIRRELEEGRPSILMLRMADLPGAGRDVFHYVVADGYDPSRGLFRLQFGDGRARWIPLGSLESGWRAAGHALFLIWAPASTDAALRQAVGLEASGRLEEASALYARVLTVRPASVRAWVNLGNAEAARGRAAEAEAAYRRALALAPEDRDALNNLAWLLLEDGVGLEEAQALAERAAAQPGTDQAAARDTLGRILLARGRCDESVAVFEAALAAEGLTEPRRAGLRQGLAHARDGCVVGR